MEESDKNLIRARYSDRLAKFGRSIEALSSGTEERRSLRFKTLAEVGIFQGARVLDVGCGFGDFYRYLKRAGLDVDYTGIDIVPELISEARLQFPDVVFEVRDIQEDPFPESSFDFVVCSQVFNLKLPGNNNFDIVSDMLKAMFKIARHGVATDFLSSYVDFREPHLYYYEPEKIFSLSKLITKRITIRHDYPLFEFCVYLYPTFDGWSKKTAR